MDAGESEPSRTAFRKNLRDKTIGVGLDLIEGLPVVEDQGCESPCFLMVFIGAAQVDIGQDVAVDDDERLIIPESRCVLEDLV